MSDNPFFDMVREAEVQVTRNGRGERYKIHGVATGGEKPIIYAEPLDKEPPSPPPAFIYILRKYNYGSSTPHDEGVYAKREQAKDSAHYWARAERMSWAKLIEKPMTWEQSDIPLKWEHMVDHMHGNFTGDVCAQAGSTMFTIECHTVQDFAPLRHTTPKEDKPVEP